MSAIVGPSDYVLESVNLYYTGHVEPQTWFKQITGTTRSGMILRDVSFEVHSGEIMAILGSKGSGKKALLDVIACRAYGPKKGYILLNGVTMNRRLFNSAGSSFSGVSDEYLQPGLTVYQTLYYEACFSLNVSTSVKQARLRQILSDVALTQAVNTNIDNLTLSEKRRLNIGVQLMKDPVVLLADEPAWNLDPLNTYFIVSILSNYAKKYGRIVILTMEKPRSDIFPFLDRVTYLCLGDVVYSGNTRLMLDYFRSIGFPCPEVENPLMYYLCLATVDRRSHERFIESNNQIGILVEKFKVEGSAFRKAGGTFGPPEVRGATPLHSLGRPSSFNAIFTLVMRTFASTFMFTWKGLENVFFHIVFLPFMFFIMWIFYFGSQNNYQHSYVTQNGLVLNTLAITYFTSIWTTILTFSTHRYRYYQESRDGHYSGPGFIISYTAACIPFAVITCLIASRIVFESSGLDSTAEWLLLFCIMLSMHLLSQQQVYTLMLIVKNNILVAATLIGLTGITITLGSSTVRTMKGLPDWLYYFTYITQTRYTGAFLNEQIFSQYTQTLPVVLNNIAKACNTSAWIEGCLYVNGEHYLDERYFNQAERQDINYYLNLGVSFIFPLVSFIVNLIVYSIPLPGLIKSKFRD